MCGLKHPPNVGLIARRRHTSCRCVDWNGLRRSGGDGLQSHTSCRCVDWNYFEQQEGEPLDVTPHVGVWIETLVWRIPPARLLVTPHVGVWIETWMTIVRLPRCSVTPHVGVWIETVSDFSVATGDCVTPHVGVWIETWMMIAHQSRCSVTPHVGVWIETQSEKTKLSNEEGHTSCRCVDWNTVISHFPTFF